MMYLNVPPWCRTLIEQSNEAYILIEDDRIAFLNEKAKSLIVDAFPYFNGYIGNKVFLKDSRLNIIMSGHSQPRLAVYSNNTSDLILNNSDRIEREVIAFENDAFSLLFSDKKFQLIKLNEVPKLPEEIHASEQCYFSLFNTVKDAIFIQDCDSIILEANQGAEEMYGYPRSYFKGKTPAEFSVYSKDDIALIKTGFEKVLQGGHQKFDLLGKRSNGEIFPKEVSLYKGAFFGKDVIIAMATDISERKQTEAQIEAYTIQLQELAETRDKVYSIVAHDLRSSFSSILGLSELLSEDWASLEDSRKQIFAKNIFIAADGSYKLLQNLLDWSKHQSGLLEYEPVSFDICGVINETLSLYRLQSTRKNISLQSEINSPTFVYADVNMVQSILRNLISNALKFTPVNGSVWVTKGEAEKENPENMVCISVHDNGVGLSEDRIQKLFDSKINITTSGTANEQGTGLGILICKEMTEQNNGKLWVESESGVGSTFSFTLPLYKN